MSAEQISAAYILVWEFQVRPDKAKDFEFVYGPRGDWAQLFHRSDGYIDSELYRAQDSPRYFTIDIWRSHDAFELFERNHLAEYSLLDQKCSALTEEEKFVAEFQSRDEAGAFLSRSDVRQVLPLEAVIRPATLADVPEIIAIERSTPSAAHWSKEAYLNVFNHESPRRMMLIALRPPAEIVGFAVARIALADCELENIVVVPNTQRRGVGRQLLYAIIDSARNQKANCVLLEVRESNSSARMLYENCGFKVSSRRKNYYAGPTEDAILYAFKL